MNLNVFFLENLTIQSIENNEHEILTCLKSKSSTSYCPLCYIKSQHVHSTYIRKPRVDQFLPYLNQIKQWCQEGKTAIWIHKQLIQQGYKGAPSLTRRKVQEIKATLLIKKSKKVEGKINKKTS